MTHTTLRIVPPLTAADLGMSASAAVPEAHSTPVDSPPGRNVIFFGSPGVGKSFAASRAAGASITRTVFHPEMDYGQFVGTYRPVVGREPGASIVGADGLEMERPVSYFAFVPGPFARAVVHATRQPEPHTLLIEEINRGDCAAIFGDVFQLLDRRPDGASEYGIDPAPDFAAYLLENQSLGTDRRLRLPPNLSLVATMNTSDQSLYPMDAAFKRRWEWEAVRLMTGADALADVTVEVDHKGAPVPWTALVQQLNAAILSATDSEDKQIGPWYVGADPATRAIREADVRNKLLFYLWHDVFREDKAGLFQIDLRSFDDLQERYDRGGLRAVVNESLRSTLDALTAAGAEKESES